MWNDSRSIILSRMCVIAFMILLAAAAISAPWLVNFLTSISQTPVQETKAYFFLITVYVGCVPAALLLLSLFFLLRRIESGQVFISRNVDSLRSISWYCFIGAVICAASAFYYFPWALVGAAAAFVGLIVRVVKNVFARAVKLQDDADFTI